MTWQLSYLNYGFQEPRNNARVSVMSHADFKEVVMKRIVFFVGEFVKLRKGTISYVEFVCPSVLTSARNNSAPTGRIFMKFDIWAFFENLSNKFEINWNLTRITGALLEYRYTFLIISRSFLLRIKPISDKIFKSNQYTLFVFSNFFFFFENRAFYEKMLKRNVVEVVRPQITIWRMRIACWKP